MTDNVNKEFDNISPDENLEISEDILFSDEEELGELYDSARANEDAIENKNELSLYLSDIGTYRLLTPKEEIDLARRVKAGDKEAREQFINCNLKLVISIAKSFRGKGLAISDLIQSGNIGLLTAIDKYDPEKGFKFSTYATWWIRQSILRDLVNNGKTIRIPVHLHDFLSKVRRFKKQFEVVNGRAPSIEEIAQALDCSEDKIKEIIRVENEILTNPSLDEGRGEDGEYSLLDSTACYAKEDTEKTAIEIALKNDINKITHIILTDRERDVIERRFGLNGYHPMTLEEIGNIYKVSKERIRQIESKALKKLRCYKSKNLLESYMIG